MTRHDLACLYRETPPRTLSICRAAYRGTCRGNQRHRAQRHEGAALAEDEAGQARCAGRRSKSVGSEARQRRRVALGNFSRGGRRSVDALVLMWRPLGSGGSPSLQHGAVGLDAAPPPLKPRNLRAGLQKYSFATWCGRRSGRPGALSRSVSSAVRLVLLQQRPALRFSKQARGLRSCCTRSRGRPCMNAGLIAAVKRDPADEREQAAPAPRR